MEIEIGRGKKARRAYGFDDVAIVPSRRTRDPDDVDITWTLGPYRFELPLLASAMDGVVSPETAGIIGKLGGLAVLNLEGIWTRYEDADDILERIAGPSQGRGHARDAGDLPGAGQGRADRPAHPGDQGPRRRRRRLADSSARRALLRDLSRRRPGHPGHPGHGHLGRARLLAGPRAQPQGVRPRAADPGRRRRLRQLLDRPAPHAHRRGRRARRRRPRRGLHHARRARHRRPAGDGDRRRRGRPLPAHARDGRVLPRDRRRRHAHRRRRREGDRLRRRRGDGRLPAGARLRGAGPRLPLGHGDLPPDAPARRPRRRRRRTARSRRSSTAPPARTTARST